MSVEQKNGPPAPAAPEPRSIRRACCRAPCRAHGTCRAACPSGWNLPRHLLIDAGRPLLLAARLGWRHQHARPGCDGLGQPSSSRAPCSTPGECCVLCVAVRAQSMQALVQGRGGGGTVRRGRGGGRVGGGSVSSRAVRRSAPTAAALSCPCAVACSKRSGRGVCFVSWGGACALSVGMGRPLYSPRRRCPPAGAAAAAGPLLWWNCRLWMAERMSPWHEAAMAEIVPRSSGGSPAAAHSASLMARRHRSMLVAFTSRSCTCDDGRRVDRMIRHCPTATNHHPPPPPRYLPAVSRRLAPRSLPRAPGRRVESTR